MESDEIKAMCTLIDLYKFDSELQKNPDLQCIICKGFLRNAYKSLCPCTYCYDCFTDYSAHNIKHCPGTNCVKSMDDVKEYLQFDVERNEKLSKLVVRCPIQFCKHKDSLRNMVSHLALHEKSITNKENECSRPKSVQGSKTYSLIETIKILKNEITYLKNNSINKTVMNEMKDDLVELKVREEVTKTNLSNAINMQSIDISRVVSSNEQHKKQIAELKAENASIKDCNIKFVDMINAVKGQMNQLRLDFNGQKESITQLQLEVSEAKSIINKQCLEIEQKLHKLCAEIDQTKKQKDVSDVEKAKEVQPKRQPISCKIGKNKVDNFDIVVTKDTRVISKSVTDNPLGPKSKSSSLHDSKSIVSVDLTKDDKISLPIPTFEWRILLEKSSPNSVCVKIKRHYFSKPFMSFPRGYLMKMVIFPDSTHLLVGFVLAIGDYDNELPWPINARIRIGLVDHKLNELYEQATGSVNLAIETESQKAALQRPVDALNTPYQVAKLMHLNTILNNQRLYRNDSIVLRCYVDRHK